MLITVCVPYVSVIEKKITDAFNSFIVIRKHVNNSGEMTLGCQPFLRVLGWPARLDKTG